MKRETYLAALEEAFANGDAVRPADLAEAREHLRNVLAAYGPSDAPAVVAARAALWCPRCAHPSHTARCSAEVHNDICGCSHQGEPTHDELPPHLHDYQGRAYLLHQGELTAEDALVSAVYGPNWKVDRCFRCGSDDPAKRLPPCAPDNSHPAFPDPWHTGEPTDAALAEADLPGTLDVLPPWHTGEPTDPPTTRELLLRQEARASVALDGETQAVDPVDRCPTCGWKQRPVAVRSGPCPDHWHSGEPIEDDEENCPNGRLCYGDGPGPCMYHGEER